MVYLKLMDQPRPTRRMDMAPRSMDGFGRSRQPAPTRQSARPVPARSMSAARPAAPARQPVAAAPVRRPAPMPVPAPRQASRPVVARQVASRRRDDAYQYEDYQDEPLSMRREPSRESQDPRMWKVVLQFVIGLAVIAAVATAVVWLWLTYYQG